MMNKQQLLLGKVAEECSELAHRALKAQQFGMSETEKGHLKTNAYRMWIELQDILCICYMLDMDVDRDSQHTFKHTHQVEKYLEYSRRLGMVEPGEQEL